MTSKTVNRLNLRRVFHARAKLYGDAINRINDRFADGDVPDDERVNLYKRADEAQTHLEEAALAWAEEDARERRNKMPLRDAFEQASDGSARAKETEKPFHVLLAVRTVPSRRYPAPTRWRAIWITRGAGTEMYSSVPCATKERAVELARKWLSKQGERYKEEN